MIHRRQLLQREPPINWRKLISDIRAMGWGTSEICFVLNVTRGTLWHWENDDEPKPSYEDGRALLKLHSECVPILGIEIQSRPSTGAFLMQTA